MKVLDLFSGIGGFSLGLEAAGFETVAFCEFDEHARKILKKHWPKVPIYNDVRTLDGLEIEFTHGKIDVICGGFPCQDISVAGKQRGLINENGEATRSGLWFQFKRLIGELRPNYVIIENVANLRSNGLVTVLQDLWALGYDAEWNIISARSVGAYHLRERIWIIAYPGGQGLERLRKPGGVSSKVAEPNGDNVNASYSDGDRSDKGIFLQTGNEGKSLRTRRTSEERTFNIPHADDIRLGKPAPTEEEASRRWAKTAACVDNWWEIESEFCGIPNGISKELDTPERIRKQRIKQLGNSIVPQIIELIGIKIMEWEKGSKL